MARAARWNAAAKLTKTGDGQDDDSGSDKFGYAVAASSSALAIVGAHGDERAFIFRRLQGSWDLVDTLAPSGGADTDFGLAVHLPERALASHGLGTLRYMAPEVMTGDGYTLAVDVYSFGVILYELCSLKKPYEVTFDKIQRKLNRRKRNRSKT